MSIEAEWEPPFDPALLLPFSRDIITEPGYVPPATYAENRINAYGAVSTPKLSKQKYIYSD